MNSEFSAEPVTIHFILVQCKQIDFGKFTCEDGTDDLADKLNAGDGLVGDLLPSIGGMAVDGELML